MSGTKAPKPRAVVVPEKKKIPPPPKPWKEGNGGKKKKYVNNLPDKLQAEGGHGVDARQPLRQTQKNSNGPLAVKTMNPAVTQNVTIDYRTIAMLAAAAIERSLALGWASNDSASISSTAYQPYYAWVYLTNSLVAAAQGTFPALQAAPLWFWELSAALMNKNAPFKTGTVNYQWNFFGGDTNTVLPVEFPLGSYSLYWGFPNPTSPATTNGFADLEPPLPYSLTLGESAISNLFAFYKSTALTKRVPFEECHLCRDVSAFQTAYSEWGGSGIGTGGMSLTIQAECFPTSPVLAKFAQYQADFWRGYQFFAKQAGTVSYIIPRMMEVMDIREMHQRISPIFKWYNFDWFFLQLSYTLCFALEACAKDNSKTPPTTCPLSSWMVQMALRATLLPRFYNYMAQDLTNVGAVPGNTLNFVPFTVSPNGVSLTVEASPSMKFPFVFGEAIRAARRLTCKLKGQAVQDFVPILGRPEGVPRLDNFSWTNAAGSPTALYATVSGEVDVSLVDLSYVNSGSKAFITSNGATLTNIIRTWNEWLTSLGNSLSTLVSVGSEPGIAALSTVINTYHMRYSTTPIVPLNLVSTPAAVQKAVHRQNSSSTLKVKGATLDFGKVGEPTPDPGDSSFYRTVAVSKLTGTQVFQDPLMRYLKCFPSPSTIGLNFEQDNSVEFQQVNQIEPFSIAFNDTSDSAQPFSLYTSMQSLAATAALLDIKTNLSSPSESEIELSAMAKAGSGGFFTSLASAIGDSLGMPGVSQVARMIGDVTGL